MNTIDDKSRHNALFCPCGKPRTGWIGSVPTCDDCVVKDEIAHEGLRKWHAFHVQRQLEMGGVVSVSGLEVEHVQTHREDGEC